MVRPVIRFAWPILVVIGVLALVVWPWSNQQIQELRMQFQARSDIDRIAPGEFQESTDGTRVIFIDKDSIAQESASNIFMVEKRADREIVTSSKSAQLLMENGDKSVLLANGQRVETDTRTQSIKVTHFETYQAKIEDQKGERLDVLPRGISTPDLFKDPSSFNLAEAGWRIGMPISAINLLLLALGITIVNPRAGQSTSLVVALLAFVVYYNLMSVGQSWVGVGKISIASYVFGVHGCVLTIAVLALLMRHNRWHIKSLWQGRGGQA